MDNQNMSRSRKLCGIVAGDKCCEDNGEPSRGGTAVRASLAEEEMARRRLGKRKE